MRDNFLFKTRDLDTHSRSASREREKRDGYSRQHTKNPNNDGSKLHIGHLPQGVSEEFIKGQFERFGRVDDVRIMRKDTNGQQLKGYIYAFVTMCNPEEARYALEGINQDRILAWSVSYSKEKGNRDSPRSPQRNPRNKPRYIEEASEDRVAKKLQQQNFMASENENPESEQNQIQDNLSGGSNDTKEPPKEPSDNPDDFISYNNNDSDEFGDNHSMLNENFIGYGNHNTADIMEEPSAYNNSLMSLLCSNDGDNSQKVKETATAKVVQQAPEKAGPATSSAEKNILNGNSILVRELWLGNLSQNISEGELRDIVSQFGDVENIEDYIKPTTRFAFVKFRTINQASRANEAVQHLKGLLNSPNLKIAFSDHQRRKNVIGNSIDFELDEDLTTIVYIGFSTGATIANENLIRDIFSRYRGEVLNIFVNQMPKQHSAKSYALVEMATKDMAKLARQKLFFEDARRETRIRLGDKNCELCILSKPRAREPFPLVNHGPNQGMHRNFQPNMQHQPMMHPHHRMNGPFGPQNMHYNGPRDHLGNPINFQNHPRGHFQNNMDHPQGYMGPEPMDGPHPNINRFGPHPGPMDMMNHGGFPMEHMGNPHFHNQGFNPNFHPGNGFNPNFGPHPFHGFNPNNNNMHMNHGFNPNMYNNGGGFEEGKRHFGGMDHSDMQSLVSSTAVSSNSKSPREKETNSENIWSGFIVKSKQNRVGVDALLVQGDDSLLRKDTLNLNISHRIMYDEIPDKPIKAMVTFIPTDNSQNELFNGLLKYFLERDRAGFISLEHHTLYLLPPCEKTSEFHQIGHNELLGLIFDTKDSGSRSNKFSRMASEIKYDQDNDSDINEALSILRSNDFEHLLI